MPNSDIQKKIHTGCNFQTFFYFSFFLVKISKKQLRKTTIQYFQFTMKLFSRPNLEFWRRKKIFMTHFQLKFTFGGQRHKFSMYIVFTTFNWKKGRESDRTSCRYGILQNIWVSTTRFHSKPDLNPNPTQIQTWPISKPDLNPDPTQIQTWPKSKPDINPNLTQIQIWPKSKPDQNPNLIQIQT